MKLLILSVIMFVSSCTVTRTRPEPIQVRITKVIENRVWARSGSTWYVAQFRVIPDSIFPGKVITCYPMQTKAIHDTNCVHFKRIWR